jgi:L-threonylcarbamoyladenylate synthase
MRIYEVKKRHKDMPFPLLLSNISQLNKLTDGIPEMAFLMAKYFWPGGLTLIMQKASTLPEYISSQSTVAVRIPGHPIPLALIKYLGNPIIGTSANISGGQSAFTADEVRRQLGNQVDFILDGGRTPGSNESTIIDITGVEPVILRHGIVPQRDIERVINAYRQRKEKL